MPTIEPGRMTYYPGTCEPSTPLGDRCEVSPAAACSYDSRMTRSSSYAWIRCACAASWPDRSPTPSQGSTGSRRSLRVCLLCCGTVLLAAGTGVDTTANDAVKTAPDRRALWDCSLTALRWRLRRPVGQSQIITVLLRNHDNGPQDRKVPTTDQATESGSKSSSKSSLPRASEPGSTAASTVPPPVNGPSSTSAPISASGSRR